MYEAECAAWADEIDHIANLMVNDRVNHNVKRRIATLADSRGGVVCMASVYTQLVRPDGVWIERGAKCDLAEALEHALGMLGMTYAGRLASREELRLSAKMIRSAVESSNSRETDELAALEPSDRLVLLQIAAKHPVRLKIDDIDCVARVTATAAVNRLLEAGYIERKAGKRKGATVTALGRSVAAKSAK